MNRAAAIAWVLVCAACASSGSTGSDGATPQRQTTTVSLPTAGPEGSLGTTTMMVTTTEMAASTAVELTATPDVVWQVLPDAISSLGIDIGTLDTPNKTVGNTQFRTPRRLGNSPISRFLDCGTTAFGAPAADQHVVTLSVLSTARPARSGTRLETRVSGRAAAPGQSQSSTCNSTGRLEQEIARTVQNRLPVN